MGYQEDWAEIQADPEWASLPAAKRKEIARFYARKIVMPETGKGSAPLKDFISKNVVGAPKPSSARIRDHLASSLVENVVPGQLAANVADNAVGLVRGLVDEGPGGIARREVGRVSDAIYDNVVAKPTGLPTAQQAREKMGMGSAGRLMADRPWDERSAAEQAGSFVGQLVDPINLAMPLNVFTKTAPVAKGINLLPKAPAASLLQQTLKGAVGAGTTNALIGGATSAASQELDTGTIDPGRVALDAALGFGVGGILGGGAAAFPAIARQNALTRGTRAAEARTVADAPDAPITGGTISTQTLDALDAARRMAQSADDPMAYPGANLPDERVIAAQIERAREQGRNIVAGERMADSASADYLRPSYEGDPLALPGAARPRPVAPPEPARMPVVREPAPKVETPAPVEAIDDGWGSYAAKMRQELDARQAQISAMEGGAPAAEPPRNLAALVSEETGTFDQQAAIDALADLTARIWRKVGRDPNAPNYIADPAAPGGFRVDLEFNDLTWLKAASRLAESGDQDAQRALMLTQQINQGRMSAPAGDLNVSTSAPGLRGNLRRVASSPEEVAARAASARQMRADEAAADALNDEWINPEHIQVKAPSGAILDGVNQTPAPKYGIAGKTLRRLASEESGQASMPHPDDVRAALGSAADLTGDAAMLVGRGYRAVTEGATSLLDSLAGRYIRSGRIAGKTIEEWRQALKHAKGNVVTDEIRRWIISDFGVPPEILRIADEARRQAHRAATPMRRQSLELLDSLDGKGQQLLELAVTEPKLRARKIIELANHTGQDRTAVTDMVQTIIDEATGLTQMLREVGGVTAEGAARWEGQYLPRSYEEKFPVISGYIDRVKTIKGTKARGIEKVVAQSSVPEMQALGWEFRGEVGGKARMWRDYTFEERMKMGQILHASNAMGKMADAFERDFRNGKILSEIAKGSDDDGFFAIRKVEGDGGPPPGYKEIADIDANSPGTGIKKWGDLAGHYVREDVHHYLKWQFELDNTLREAKDLMGINLWKRFKTIWNPAHYVNNFMNNIPTLELAGGSTGDLPAAWREASTRGELFQQLEDFGTIRNGRVAQDLAVGLAAENMDNLSPLSAIRTMLSAVKSLERRGGNLAQATDDLFRLAYVQRKVADGMDFEAAAREAEKVFYDASNVTAPAAKVLELGIPFVKVLWYQMDKLPELLIKNPAKAAVMMSYFAGTKWLIDRATGTTDRQAEARDQLIPSHMKKVAGTGYVPTPLRDSKGNQLVLNTANWSPVGFLDNSDQVGLPYFPSAAMPGGPVPTLYQALINKDLFREKDLRTAAGDETARFLMENLGPGVVGRAGTLWDALNGREAYSGLPYDAPTALAGLLGLKLQPYSPELGVKRLNQEFEKQKGILTSAINYRAQMMAKNPQDAARYESEIAALTAKVQRLAEEHARNMERASGAFQ